jgi:SAM-dependent methyltransferase
MMDNSLLVRLFGFPATLIHGDTLVLDRWLWLRRRLPETANGERLVDVGCGTGAFTIGAAKRGYIAHGLSWDERNQSEAAKRARICGTPLASFNICDVRELDAKDEYKGAFDVAICAENIEHILDDARLVKSIAGCLKPGGRLLLTTPNYYYKAITKGDNGPFCTTETGWHVRRGYTRSMLLEVIDQAGLACEEISYCSGIASQKVTWLMRKGTLIHHLFGWAIVLPLRAFVPLVDALIYRWSRTPAYSICLEAYKPRFVSPPELLESKRLPEFVAPIVVGEPASVGPAQVHR